jgi:AraC-like DNA-binding protein
MKEIIYSFPMPETRDPPFWLEMAGVSYCDGSYRILRYDSPILVLEYVAKGTGTVRIQDRVFHPGAGDVYLLHQRMDHDYYSDGREPWTKLWFNVGGALCGHLVQAYRMTDVFQVEKAGGRVQALFEEGLAAVRQHHSRRDKSAIHGIAALQVHRILSALSGAVPPPGTPEPVRRMKEYIDRHYARPVKLSDISRESGRSPSQAIRLYKKETGMTPYDYLLERRFGEARLLLRDTAMPVKAIAERLGFCDEYHFSASFKRRAGVPPLSFRKKQPENT